MNWRRTDSGRLGELRFENVPIHDIVGQNAAAYLHVVGIPRTLPSHRISIVFDTDRADLGEGTHFDVYSSPSPEPPGVAARDGGAIAQVQDPYTISIDVSESLARLGAANQASVTLFLIGPAGPIPGDRYAIHDIFFTRRSSTAIEE